MTVQLSDAKAKEILALLEDYMTLLRKQPTDPNIQLDIADLRSQTIALREDLGENFEEDET